MRLAFSVQRFHPELDTAPHEGTFYLDVSRGMTVLDALIRIKNEQDGSLAFRYSCRSAICGSCAMTINGTEKLACRTAVRKEWGRHGEIAVGPLRNMPVLKDLAVDMRSFWGKVGEIDPWIQAESDHTVAPSARPEGAVQFHNVDACIMCGACVAACTVHEVDKGFIGPAALAKAYRFVADPREGDASRRARLTMLQEPTGMWDCTRCNFCVEVCPKDVQPMEAIIRLRRSAIEAGLTDTGGARHVVGFRDVVARFGRLNEALMPLKVIGLSLKRFLHVAPLAVRMLVNGKVPNPLHPAIAGVGHIRSILTRKP